jgi:hypothetical protein
MLRCALTAAAVVFAISGSAFAQQVDPRLRQQPIPIRPNPQVVVGPSPIECGAGTMLRAEGSRRTCVAAPSASGSRAWIVNTIDARTTSLIYAVNPSDRPARIGFTVFDQAGTLVIDRSRSVNVNAGAIGVWLADDLLTQRHWVLVTSDRPVLVDAVTSVTVPGSSTMRQLSAHRLDCSNPDGYEFACRAVAAAAR